MYEPDSDTVAIAEKLKIPLTYSGFLQAIARLTVLVGELQSRLDVLERKRR
jgi:hypothetical protein